MPVFQCLPTDFVNKVRIQNFLHTGEIDKMCLTLPFLFNTICLQCVLLPQLKSQCTEFQKKNFNSYKYAIVSSSSSLLSTYKLQTFDFSHDISTTQGVLQITHDIIFVQQTYINKKTKKTLHKQKILT